MEQQPLSWSHLPDVCLLLIFKKLSMSDMICSVGQVCTNWGKVQREEMGHRNTLMIATVRERDNDKERILKKLRKYENPYGSDLIEHVRNDDGLPWAQLQPLDKIEFNTLRVPSNVFHTEAFTSLVMDTLPNITHLTLVLYVPFHLNISTVQQLRRLISHYTTRLVSLKLDFETDEPDILGELLHNFRVIVPLFNSINRLESLRHLRLNTNFVQSYPELSILSRLATFTTNLDYPIDSLLASLRQYATGNDDLCVECDTSTRMELKDWIRLDPQLAAKFTRLNVDHVKESHYEKMRLFCQRFASLQSLGLAIWGMPMTKLAQCLSQLPELIYLKLRFVFNPEEEEEEEEEEEQIPQPEFTPVSTVRMLFIDMNTNSHHDTELLHLHQIFPNLQVLHFRHDSPVCDECNYDSIPYSDNDLKIDFQLRTRIVYCMHLAVQPFRQCANLHTVKLDSDDEEVMKFLPQGLITRDQL